MDILKQQFPVQNQMQFKRRLKLILDKKWMILGIFILGLIIALIISYLLPKQFSSTSRISFKYNSVNNTLLSNNGSLANEVEKITSKKNLSTAVEKLEKDGRTVSISDILNSINILEDRTSTSIAINSVAEEAALTSELANAVVSSFSEESILNSRTPYLITLKLLSDRIKEVQDLSRNNQIQSSTNLNVNEERIVTRLAEFESELEKIEINNQFYSAQSQYLEKIIERDFPIVGPQLLSASITEIANNQLRIERLETKKALSSVSQKLRNYTINYPWTENFRIEDLPKLYLNFNDDLSTYTYQLAKENNVKNYSLLQKLAAKLYITKIMINSADLSKSIIFNILNDLENQFNRIPFANLDNARQTRASRFQNNLLIKLRSKELKLQNRQNDFLAEVDSIVKAEVPDTFFSPNIPLYLFIGGLLGLISGIILAATSKKTQLELITSTEELEESGYKIISQIPKFPIDSALLLDSVGEGKKKNLTPNIVRSFEGIETFLKYGNLEKSLKTIMITSGYADEGKSLIASNIAIALSRQGNKVLLVDADLKKPNLNKYFKVKSTPSLAHYLFRKKELDEIIRGTHCKNLDLITCIEFPQNPAVIVTSERMKNFMDQVRRDYDYVVYDTSSLCQLKETAKIAKRVDEVILVVRANKSKYSELMNTEALLNEGGVINFNIVLNDIDS